MFTKISYLKKKHDKELDLPIWGKCICANLYSGIFGFFFSFIVAIIFFEPAVHSYDNLILLTRQIFLISCIFTIIVEGVAYQCYWPQKKYHIPKKKIWLWTFIANILSYGLIAWLFAINWLQAKNTLPMLWQILGEK